MRRIEKLQADVITKQTTLEQVIIAVKKIHQRLLW
jgi:uncharacterized protein YoxC